MDITLVANVISTNQNLGIARAGRAARVGTK